MQINEPQFVIVPDEDYEWGLNHGAYPQFNNELNSGKLVVLSKEDASSKYGIIQPEENKVYVRNPYDGIYHDLGAEDLNVLFIEKKAIQIREVLIMFGVYSAKLENSVNNSKETDLRINGKFQKSIIPKTSKGENEEQKKSQNEKPQSRLKIIKNIVNNIVSVGASFNSNNKNDQKLATTIELQPKRRQAKTPQEIRHYINNHGLGDESSLNAWLTRYERDGKMVGAEDIEVSFLGELAKVRKGALDLNILAAETSFNIEYLRQQTNSFYKKITVDFSGPEDSQ
jgi:hypothetical protein